MWGTDSCECFRRSLSWVGGVIILSVGVFVGAGSCVASAAPPDSDRAAFTLGEVVVTDTRDILETPTTISVVTAEDIEKQSATNLGEALRFVPGAYFRQARSKNEYYIQVRGFEQENILILMNGMPIYVPYEGLVNLSDIPVTNIEEIKVIKGASSVLYGPNALGGVINVITKSGTARPDLSASYQISDYGTHHLAVTHGWKVGNFSYFLTATHRESDGYKLAGTFALPEDVLNSMSKAPTSPSGLKIVPIPADDGRRDNSDYKRDSVTFTGSYDFDKNNSLGLSFEYYNNEYGVPPVPIYRETKQGFFYYPRYWRFSQWERYTINLIQESKITDTFRIKLRGFYDDYKNVLDAYDDPTYSTVSRLSPPSGKSIFDDFTTGGNVYAFYTGLPHNEFRLGFTYKKDVHRENFKAGPYDKFSSDTYSLAVEDVFKAGKGLSIMAGASYDIFDKRVRDVATSPGAPAGDDVNTLNPQIGVTYEYSNSLTLFASGAKKTRFPTLRNLYASGVVGPQGDPNLQEETSYNYELGCRWMLTEKSLLETTLFYSHVKNLINFDNQIGRFEQYAKARMSGIELSLTSKLTESLQGRLGYTLLDAQNRSTVTITNQNFPALVYKPDDLPYRPKHKIDFEFSQVFVFGMRIDLYGSYLSSRVYYDHADPNNNKVLVAKKEKLGDYLLLNARVAQKVGKHVEFFASVENILNKEYQDLFQFPAKGVTFWGGVKARL